MTSAPAIVPAPDGASEPARELEVLCLGLPRTGSSSLMHALTILGFENVHHSIRCVNDGHVWSVLNRAADATFECLPTFKPGQHFTRDQWDELYGPYDAACEVASLFSPQLIEAYPDAKVILVSRDYEKWYHSMDVSVWGGIWSPLAKLSIKYVEPILGSVAGIATRKMLLGYFEAPSGPDEARKNSRRIFDRHHERIRQMVPSERLLEYKLGSGWKPLCSFLEKPVPIDTPFPWVNEAEAMRKMIVEIVRDNAMSAAWIVLPRVAAAGAVGVGVYWAWRGR